MTINIEQLSKRFIKQWIFKHINLTISTGDHIAILGPNGSGKSTFLRVIAAIQNLSKGKITYTHNNLDIERKCIHHYTGFSAPALDLIPDLTLQEFLQFHFTHKRILNGLDVHSIIETIGLQHAHSLKLKELSSGMLQRVKLAQAIFSDAPLLILDEPCSNLDQKGIQQYNDWMALYAKNRTVLIGSNDPNEYHFCQNSLNIMDYKY